MAGTFRFELVLPERLLFSEIVEEVILPGSEGYFTVMVNHLPMVTCVIPGVVRVKVMGQAEKVFIIYGGYADIASECCSLLVETVVLMDDLSLQDIERRIVKARAEFEKSSTVEQHNKAEDFLYQLTAIRNICCALV
ncbi:MAG: F-type H+-transporting ATPase subunit epsilon [Candidatus Tokpelaia sp. JSC085]|nr:MAG: F-type H+-transporting ATPase subunit epsilon [Candidatus Tokpelaia sp. JSC085]